MSSNRRSTQPTDQESGATSVEYGFMIAVIAAVVAVALVPFGFAVNDLVDAATAAFQ